jgi:hypothetical protein
MSALAHNNSSVRAAGAIRIGGVAAALAALFAGCAFTFALPSAATADVINISATTFVLRTASGSGDLAGEQEAGTLQGATGTYFAPVTFPPNAGRICRFSLVFRDFDETNNITARLMRKRYTVGGKASTGLLLVAQMQSKAVIDGVQKISAAVINSPVVLFNRAFYYVELEIPAPQLQVLGVEIEHKPACE